jgi:hypothetical protein
MAEVRRVFCILPLRGGLNVELSMGRRVNPLYYMSKNYFKNI